MNKNLILSIAILVCFKQTIFAQNNNSPYSIIGIGDIEKSSFDRTSGMGHAGMSLFSNRFLYNANPASYSALDDKFFNVEVAARYKGINYSGNPISSTENFSSDLQFKKIVAAIKIKPKWGAAFGLLPFSSANYSFTGYKSVAGSSITLPAYYEGTGSINQFFLANSYKLFKNFSLGLQTAILFGQLNQTETISSGISDSTLITNRKIGIGTPYFKSGFQYHTKLNSKVSLFFGGTAAFKTPINGSNHVLVSYGNTELPETPASTKQVFTLPAQYAGSIATKIKDKFTVAVDYAYQNWSDQNYKGLSYQLVNTSRWSGGFEYSKKQNFRDFSFEKHFLQAGCFYNNSYLRINNQQINDYGITFGGGMNFIKSNLGLQLSVEVGRRGTINSGLIQENYTQANITLSYRDFWFVKVKKYD